MSPDEPIERSRPRLLDGLAVLVVVAAIAFAASAPRDSSAVAPPPAPSPVSFPASLPEGEPPDATPVAPIDAVADAPADAPLTIPPASGPLSVAVVGDSLSLSARQHLRSSFETIASELTIDAEEGRTISAGSGPTSSIAAESPDVVIVSLGTNDVATPLEAVTAATERLLVDLVDVPCVLWVDAQPFRDELAALNDEVARSMRSFIGARTDRRGGIVEWSAVAGPTELHTTDGYHLSELGRTTFAELLAQSVVSLC